MILSDFLIFEFHIQISGHLESLDLFSVSGLNEEYVDQM